MLEFILLFIFFYLVINSFSRRKARRKPRTLDAELRAFGVSNRQKSSKSADLRTPGQTKPLILLRRLVAKEARYDLGLTNKPNYWVLFSHGIPR